ncbi:Rieske (2Fe-2S) protein [Mycobacterium sp. Marseille-P9652]|uniref:Rieske (2Fe-2S) protein n=1 Tax=Mycobacterium sp. Marseille-P9652 TaxID=2654950 RepID=UPI0018D16003|nr:Rieske (2Fe-2S) protein [Mycobacterium sp. Marseille-P9652]
MDPSHEPRAAGIRDIEATRRRVLIGSCAVGAAAAIAACGPQQTKAAPGGPTGGDQAAPPAAPQVLHPADVPVGGGVILADQDTVVTQPQPGQFRAFSATCTHLGCQVERVSDGTIKCPCHGSQYSVTDGSVVRGPAPKPLPARTVTLNNGALTIS